MLLALINLPIPYITRFKYMEEVRKCSQATSELEKGTIALVTLTVTQIHRNGAIRMDI